MPTVTLPCLEKLPGDGSLSSRTTRSLFRCAVPWQARGEVCFLKPDVLGAPDDVVVGDYSKASAWLASLTDPSTGERYKPLPLDPALWEVSFRGGHFLSRPLWKAVVSNFTRGRHGYAEVCELVAQSNASLHPVLDFSSTDRRR